MSQTHVLKTWDEPFEAIWLGLKTAEFRNNDREFELGDVVVLREYHETHDTHDWYNPREVIGVITYLGAGFGIPEGYCQFCFTVHHRGWTDERWN